ncbi:uncharacterized protein IUM83_02393 [Phytophthora cinnamomi]|uniref:uncharacterized protein n=1 Tax=Phytophthora cinnamomi TaxID=4785 RepID=UPI00355A4AEB|nr:hypothetical protein IUM83_02393 [Phytophthora cinnamomi]
MKLFSSTSTEQVVGPAPTRCCVQSASIKYVLDFSYCHGNNRHRPSSMSLSATIVADPSRAMAPGTEVSAMAGTKRGRYKAAASAPRYTSAQ